jgi:putative nucleotidyltransferase with HDIG domain
MPVPTKSRILPAAAPRLSGHGEDTHRTEVLTECEQFFDVSFSTLDGMSAEPLLLANEHRGLDWSTWCACSKVVADSGEVEVIAEEGPVCLLAIPVPLGRNESTVYLGVFCTNSTPDPAGLRAAARLLGWETEHTRQWLQRQTPWRIGPLVRTAKLLLEKITQSQRVVQIEKQVRRSSEHMALVYEEISLLHRLTQNLRLSRNDEELSGLALEWMQSVIPADVLQLLLLPVQQSDATTGDVRDADVLLSQGGELLTVATFQQLIASLAPQLHRGPVIRTTAQTSGPDWQFPSVRQLVMVPLVDGEHTIGYLAAINHTAGREFGSVEANLLASVGTILGIHSGNIDLYRKQAEFVNGVVKAMTSAIDAKDPYTRGHSDRVARIAVKLAEQLGLDPQQQKTIYLSGLLHDIGKIGVSDQVLGKPDKLTPDEFEHIKTHTTIGYKILRGLTHLDDVLPVVLHHHEQWDGMGYPQGLAGENIPRLARIVAVADAFDAMASDRPYRPGMAAEKLDSIMSKGAAQQWDAEVVSAYMRIKDDLHALMSAEREIAQRASESGSPL